MVLRTHWGEGPFLIATQSLSAHEPRLIRKFGNWQAKR